MIPTDFYSSALLYNPEEYKHKYVAKGFEGI